MMRAKKRLFVALTALAMLGFAAFFSVRAALPARAAAPAEYTALNVQNVNESGYLTDEEGNRLTFFIGQDPNGRKEDFTVIATYGDNQMEEVAPDNFNVEGEITRAGDNTLTVKSGSVSCTVKVWGAAVDLARIEVEVDTQKLQETPLYATDPRGIEAVKDYIKVTGVNNDGTEGTLSKEGYTLEGSFIAGEREFTAVSAQNPNVHSEPFTVTITAQEIVQIFAKSNQGGAVIYSGDLETDIEGFVKVTALYNDGSEGELLIGQYKVRAVKDFRPDNWQTGVTDQPYERSVVAYVEVGGEEITSNEVELTVTPDTINRLQVEGLTGAYYALESIDPESITVTVDYENGMMRRTLKAGEYTIRYGEHDGDHFLVGDTTVTISYTENGVTKTFSPRTGVTVMKLPVNAPVMDVGTPQYSGEEIARYFRNFNENRMQIVKTDLRKEISGSDLAVYAVDADSYSIQITLANENYEWNENSVNNSNGELSEDKTTITYNWEIAQNFLQSSNVEVSMPGWVYGTGTDEDHLPEVSLRDDEGNPIGMEGARITYTFTGMDNGNQPYNGDTPPKNAGSYSVAVHIEGLKNYQPVESVSYGFTITRATVEKPTLAGNKLTYKEDETGTAVLQNPTINHTEQARYSVTDNGGAEVKKDGYTVTFDLINKVNYMWEGGSTGSFTISWNIVAGTNEISVAIGEEWTYSEEPADPVPTLTFGKGRISEIKYTYQYRPWNSSEEGWKDCGAPAADSPAGYYRVKASLTAGQSADGSVNYAAAESGWQPFTINRKQVEKDPALNQSVFTYAERDGAAVLHEVGGWDTSGVYYTVSKESTISADQRGSYKVVLVLTDNYCWTDGTFANKSLSWEILQAENAFTGEFAIENITYGETPAPKDGTLTAPFGEFEFVYYADAACNEKIDAPVNAGTYYVRAEIAETDNYKGAQSAAKEFKIFRAAVAVPETADSLLDTDYNEKDRTITFTFAPDDRAKFSYTFTHDSSPLTGGEESGKLVFVSKAAGGYQVVFTLKDGGANYTFGAAAQDPDDPAVTKQTFEWNINKAENPILTDAEVFDGWTYGNAPSIVSDLNARTTYDKDKIRISYAVYDAADTGFTSPVLENVQPEKDLAAGSYVLRFTAEGGANTKFSEKKFPFTVAKGQAKIEIDISSFAGWTYGDKAKTPTFTVKAGELALSVTPVSAYYTRGWLEDGEFETLVSDMNTADAGYYILRATVAGTDNYEGATLDSDMFTIAKYKVDAPVTDVAGTDKGASRRVEFGKALPDLAKGGEHFAFTGYILREAEGEGFKYTRLESAPAENGFYYFELTLNEPDNYAWNFTGANDTDREGEKDIFAFESGENDETRAWLWFRITSTQYEATASVAGGGWVYGSDPVKPVIDITSDIPGIEEVARAIEAGKVEYRFVGHSFNEPSKEQTFGFGADYAAVAPKNAGVYTLTVRVLETTNFAECVIDAGEITISPAPLTANIVGSGGVYGANEPSEAKISGAYYYGENQDSLDIGWNYRGSPFLASLGEYDDSVAPERAGEYQVTLSFGNKNYCIVGGTAEEGEFAWSISAEYNIKKAELTLTPTGFSTVYGNEATGFGYSADGLVPDDEIETVLQNVELTYTAANEKGAYVPGRTNGNVGAFTVRIANLASDFENNVNDYTVTFSATAQMQVTPRTLTVEITPNANLKYDGTAKTATFIDSRLTGDDLEFETLYYRAKGSGGYESDDSEPTEAAEYLAKVFLRGGAQKDNYSYTTPAEKSFTIEAADIDAKVQSKTVTYKGSAYNLKNELVIGVTLQGGQQAEYKFTVDGSELTEIKDVKEGGGAYTVKWEISATNHKPRSGEVSFTIEKAELTLTPDALEITYGEPAEGFTYKASGLKGVDRVPDAIAGVDVSYKAVAKDGGAEYAPGAENGSAGKYDIVLSVSGSARNYDVKPGENAVMTVSPRPIGVTLLQNSGEYAGRNNPPEVNTAPNAAYSYTGEQPLFGDDLGIELALAETSFDVGFYGYKTVEWDNKNYAVTFSYEGEQTSVFEIYKRTVTVKAGNVSVTYGENWEISYEIVGAFGDEGDGIEVTFLYNGSDVKPENAGTYTVTATFEHENYRLSAENPESQFEIRQKDLVISAKNGRVMYGETFTASEAEFDGLAEKFASRDKAALEKLLSFGTDYAPGAQNGGVGDYTITLAFRQGYENDTTYKNYNVTNLTGGNLTGGTLSVYERPIRVDTEYLESIYGEEVETSQLKASVASGDGETHFGLYAEDAGRESEIFRLYVEGFDGMPTDAGEYKILTERLLSGLGKNYEILQYGQKAKDGDYTAGHAVYKIVPENVTVTLTPDFASNTYDSQPKSYSASGTSVAIVVKYEGREGTDYPETTAAPINAGAYSVWVEVEETENEGNYVFNSGTKTGFTIERATYSWVKDIGFDAKYTHVYDGTAFVPELHNKELIANGLDGVEVQVNKPAGVTNVTSAEGVEYIVTFTTESENYVHPEPVRTRIVVQPRILGRDYGDGSTVEIEWETESGSAFVYNGTDRSGDVKAYYTPIGGQRTELVVSLIGDDEFKTVRSEYYEFRVTGFRDDDDARANYAISAEIGDTKANYRMAPLEVDIKAGNGTAVYGEPVPAALGFEYTGAAKFVAGDDVKIAVSTAAKQGSPVGRYATNVTGVSGADRGNYTGNWTSAPAGEFTITKRTLTVEDFGLPQNAVFDNATRFGAEPVPQNVYVHEGERDSVEFAFLYKGQTAEGEPYENSLAPMEAGRYTVTLSLAEGAGDNANYAFEPCESEEFTIGKATIAVSAKGFKTTYTGEDFYFQSEGGHDGWATLTAQAHGITATWEFSEKDIEQGGLSDGDYIRSVRDVKSWDGATEGAYTIYYRVSAKNHDDKFGSFEVLIKRAGNAFKKPFTDIEWTFEDEVIPSAPVADTDVTATFGGVVIEYFRTRTGEEGNYQYAEPIESAELFSAAAGAGEYYARVTVQETKNYAGLLAHGVVEIAKKTLSVGWEYDSVSLDDDAVTRNVLRGYRSDVMEVAPGGDFAALEEGGGSYFVQKPGSLGTYTIIIRLKDTANYKWSSPAADASLTNVIFTVSTMTNTVTVTIESWTYGDEVLPEPQASATSEGGGFTFSYAARREGQNPAEAFWQEDRPTDAGTYWVRAVVEAHGDFGRGTGYGQFEIKPYALKKPTASAAQYVYSGELVEYFPDNYTSEVQLPNRTQVQAMSISGNRGINAGDYEAIVTLVSSNFCWEGGGTEVLSFPWKIDKKPLDKPVFAEGGTSVTSVYGDKTVQLLSEHFDAEVMGISFMTTGSGYTVTEEGPALTAQNAGTYRLDIVLKFPKNYMWRGAESGEENATVSLTWTITPKPVDLTGVGFEERYEFTYSGAPQRPSLSGELPAYVSVSYSSSGYTNATETPHTFTATLRVTDNNYCFEGGAREKTVSTQVSVVPFKIDEIFWTEDDFVYNGQDRRTEVQAYYVNALGGRTDLEVTPPAAFKDHNGAEGYAFSAGFALEDARENQNYAFGCATEKTYHIRQLAVTVTLNAQGGVYQNAPALDQAGYTVSGAVYGDFRLTLSTDAVQDSPVGTYTITAVFLGDTENYDVEFVNGVYTVTPREIFIDKITVSDSEYGSEGEPASVSEGDVTNIAAGDTFADDVLKFLRFTYSGTDNSGEPYNGDARPALAGRYAVTVSLDADAGCNYFASPVSAIFTVTRKVIPADAFETEDKPFSGKPQTSAVSLKAGYEEFGGLYEVSSCEEGTAAGAYGITLALTEDAAPNYRWGGSAENTFTLTWNVLPASSETVSITAPGLTAIAWGKEKGGFEIAADATISLEGAEISGYVVSSSENGVYTLLLPENGRYILNAGEYFVKAWVSADANGNYAEMFSEAVQVSVGRGTYDMSGVSLENQTFTYDGTHTFNLSVEGELPVGADGVRVEVRLGEGSLNATGAEGKRVTAAFTTASANYLFANGQTSTELSAVLAVLPREAEVIWTEKTFVYNGKDRFEELSAYFINAEGDRVDLTIGRKEFINAGEYGFAVEGFADGNYLLADEEKTYVIEKAAISLSLGQKDYVYGEEAPAYTLTGNLGGGAATARYYNDAYDAAAAPENAGYYRLTVTVAETANYLGGYASVTFTVKRAAADFSVAIDGWTYGETPKAPVLTGEHGAVSYLYTGTANDGTEWNNSSAPVKAGTYTLTATDGGTQNREGGSASANFTIARVRYAAPTLGETDQASAETVYGGETDTLALTGFDPLVMGISGTDTAAGLIVDAEGNVFLFAPGVGEYTVTVFLKDTDNCEWLGAEGAAATAPLAYRWTVSEAEESLMWLIATFSGVLAAELVLFAVLLAKRRTAGGPPDGADGASAQVSSPDPAPSDPEGSAPAEGDTGEPEGETHAPAENGAGEPEKGAAPQEKTGGTGVKTYSFAPAMFLLLAAPLGQTIASAALGAACLAFLICDIVLLAKRKKKVLHEEQVEPPQEEPAPEIAAAEEPAEERAEEPAPEPQIDLPAGKVFVRYDYSFRAKLIQSPVEVQERWRSMSGEFCAYAKVKGTESWKQVRFHKGRALLARAVFKGRTLCVAFALDPKEFENTKYRGEDVSEVKRFEHTPMLLRITSDRKAKYAKELFALVAAQYELEKGEPVYTEVIHAYRPTEELLEQGLVKKISEGDGGEEVTFIPAFLEARTAQGEGQEEQPPASAAEEKEEIAEEQGETIAEDAAQIQEETAAEEVAEEVQEETPQAESEEDEEPQAEEEEDGELSETEEGSETAGENVAAEGEFFGDTFERYNYSFRAKLIRSPAEVQAYYGEIADEVRSYRKMGLSVGWKQVRIYSGRETIAAVLFKGKTLCVAFALDPKEYENTKYHGKDVSSFKRFENTPMLLRVTSERKAKYAKFLLSELAAKRSLTKGETVRTEFYLPPRTLEELLAEGLVRRLSKKGGEAPAAPEREISVPVRERVTLSEAQTAVSDEIAATFVEEKAAGSARPASRSERAAVNVDTLSRAFAAGETVTLAALKEKKLVPPRAAYVKVLARGALDKALVVEANDFSPDAVKMILLTGGKAIRIT